LIYIIVLCIIDTEVNGKGVRFHLLELLMYFKPKIGNVMFIKTSLIQHTTRNRGFVNQLGMCVYMQASFFLMWRLVQDDMRMLKNDMKLSE
jgi:hypothetical protein